LATLTSVSDDDLGEELTVVWEVEPGREVLPVSRLPNIEAGGFDDPERLGAFLDAVRWGTVASADTRTLQAPFRSGITIQEHQLEPVARALQMPRVNLLIADDVGLGKTIEAGLIAQELILRHRVRRILVICPASLTRKWAEEMDGRFGLDFQVLDAAALKELRRSHGLEANPFSVYPRTIVSLQWLRTPRVQRLLDEVLSPENRYPGFFDLLIVDEAHHCAPPAPRKGQRGYAVDSKQTVAVRRVGEHASHRLFLSATPHNGYSESWQALLEMLDPQRFLRGADPEPAVVDQVVIRRLKDQILDSQGRRVFPDRVPRAVEVEYAEDEKRIHELLERYTAARRRRARGLGVPAGDLVTLLLKKRLFSSPAAFATTLHTSAATLDRPTGPPSTGPNDQVPDWLSDALEWAADDTDGAEADDLDTDETDLLTRAANLLDQPERQEGDYLAEMQAWCDRHAEPADSKALALVQLLDQICRPGGQWNDERIIVFTEYLDTLNWLDAILSARGLGGEHLGVIHGGIDEARREHIKHAFQAHPSRDQIRILLATDAAGEGIDLQNHCHRVVNYDIPFNPNRLEQRIGRVDRIGQTHQVEVVHFVGTGWEDAPAGSYAADLEYLSRVATKIAIERRDLGPVNPVIAAAIEARMLGRPILVDPTSEASPTAQQLQAERDLRVRAAQDDAARLRRQLDDSVRRLHVAPANVRRVVDTGLALAGQPPLIDQGDGTFAIAELTGGWSRTLEGLPDPLTGQPRLLAFDPTAAVGREDVVIAHLEHPLVAHCTRLLRSAIWGGRLPIHRATAIRADLPEGVTDGGLLVVAFARLVIVGGDGARLHEEVVLAGREVPPAGRSRRVELDASRYRDVRAGVEAALDPGACRPAPAAAETRLIEEWDDIAPRLADDVERRADQQFEGLTRDFARRQQEESARVEGLFDQLTATLRQALTAGPTVRQLSFDDLDVTERQQLDRDRRAWQDRLDGIEADRHRELEAVGRRFAGARNLVFPFAVALCTSERPR
jgi:superfamily II DNA or RNA helicase